MSDMQNGARADVSIVIVNYNAVEQLKACLLSIEADGGGLAVETIVVDNASVDGSARMVRRRFPDVSLIANEDNAGYTKANNQGIAASSAEFVLLLNNDTELPPGTVASLVEFLARHPRTGAVAPRVVNPDGSAQHNVKTTPTALTGLFGRTSPLRRLFPDNRISRRHLYLDKDYSRPFRVDVASTACLLVRRAVLDEIGGFDTSFFCYWSDSDLCARIRAAGWTIHFDPRVSIVHYEHQGGVHVRSKRAILDFNDGARRYYAKHEARRTLSVRGMAAAAGLAVNATAQLFAHHLGGLRRIDPGALLNPAGSPEAKRAIRGLAAACVAVSVGVAVIGAGAGAGVGEPMLGYHESPAAEKPAERVGGAARRPAEEFAAFSRTSATSVALADPTELPAPIVAEVPRPNRYSDEDDVRPAFISREVAEVERHLVGVSAYLLDPDDSRMERKVEAMSRAGLETVRLDMRWDRLEPSPGAWEFERVDAAVRLLTEAGIEPVVVLCFTPRWASSAPGKLPADQAAYYPPASMDEYRHYVSTVVARYADEVAAWQIWIEPDLSVYWPPEPDAAAFVRLFDVGASAVRAADPSAKVVFPGLTTSGKLGFLEEALACGAADNADVFAYHDYSEAPEGGLREEATNFVNLVRRYASPATECWFTEMGWSTYERAVPPDDFIAPVDEATQATNIVKRLLLSSELPFTRTFVWELSDVGDDPEDILQHFGLLRSDLSEKPSYRQVSNLMPLYTDRQEPPPFLVSSADGVRVHPFTNADGDAVVAVWGGNGSPASAAIRLATDDVADPVATDLETGRQTALSWEYSADGGLSVEGVGVSSSAVSVFRLTRPDLFTDPGSISPGGAGDASATEVRFSLEASAAVTLRVLDGDGDVVRILAEDRPTPLGSSAVTWDGRDAAGHLVPDGRYVVELAHGGEVARNSVTVDTMKPEVTGIRGDVAGSVAEGDKPFVTVPVRYRLSEPCAVEVDVFDADGRFCARLESGVIQPAGQNALQWPVSILHYEEGAYWFRVRAADTAGNTRQADSPRPALLDVRKPEVKASFRPATFSPDGDGAADTTSLRYTLSEPADVVAVLVDAKGKNRYLFAYEDLAAGRHTFAWDGWIASPAGSRVGVPAGEYTLRLSVTDRNGNVGESEASVRVSRADYSAPGVKGLCATRRTITVNADGEDDSLEIAYRVAKLSDVLIYAEDRSGRTYPIAAYPACAPGLRVLAWDGRVAAAGGAPLPVPGGEYRLCVRTTDRAGGSATSATPLTVETDTTPPDVGEARVSPPVIHADDARGGSATVSLALSEAADVVLYARGADGVRRAVCAMPGRTAGPLSIVWDGALPGGRTATGETEMLIVAGDPAGNRSEWRATVTVRASSEPLRLSSAAFSPLRSRKAAGAIDRWRVTYTLSRGADVLVSIRTLAGETLHVRAARERAGRCAFEWDGTVFDPETRSRVHVRDGTYEWTVTAMSGSDRVVARGRVQARSGRGR